MKKSKSNTATTPALIAPDAPAPAHGESGTDRPPLPPIDMARRRVNRELPAEKVVQLLEKEAPGLFNMAEVIGKWVWIQFREKQPRTVTALLAEFGFHWNNKRQAWQHPGGALTSGAEHDPREKYPSYFPADVKAA